MATSLAVSTPTRSRSPASVNTPPTPRLGGFGDNWEPYSPAPRKSARISSRATDNRTPSPNSSVRISRPAHPRPLANTSASRSSAPPRSHQSQHPTGTMTSPPATLSPQKKRQPAAPTSASASRSVSGSLTAESIRNAAAALGQSQKMDFLAASSAALALPTPAKTPARKHSDQSEKDVNAIARNLFGRQTVVTETETEMAEAESKTQTQAEQPASPKKTRTKRSSNGISLDSFEIHDEEAPIEIFTDSENRLPEADASTDNPFYGESGIAASAAPVRRSSRHKKSAAVEKELVEEKLKREDGLLYVFRGKKLFRKFTEGDAASRPAVKPRLLFPTAAKASKENEIFEDEEAETDIEEQAPKIAALEEEFETPAEAVESKVDTPKAPKFAPTSPPTTSRATRSKKVIIDQLTPVKGKGKRAGGSRSPFDGWRRTKNSPSSSTGQKRAGDPLASDVPKKTKT